MALDLIVTSSRYADDPAGKQFVDFLGQPVNGQIFANTTVYYDFPAYADYESISHRPDFLLVSPNHGIIVVKLFAAGSADDLSLADRSVADFTSNLYSRLLRSRELRSSLTILRIPIYPVIINVSGRHANVELETDTCTTYPGFSHYIDGLNEVQLTSSQISEARSIIEGAKALTRTQKRSIDDPNRQPLANALVRLETEITNFDEKQRRVALIDVGGPTRIRGLAGSGKTIILAMKAAQQHMERPNDLILVTFYTKSLRSTLKTLITRFYRHYSEVDPDWKKIHIRHGWGSASVPGVYGDAARRHGRLPMSLDAAKAGAGRGGNAFDFACRDLLRSAKVEPIYDHILIDEGQDFPSGFYELCYHLTKGERDRKDIVWAYDELQNILDVEMRTAEALFGTDEDGQPRVSLDRSLPLAPPGATNDAVLSKCYRNQRDVLVVAHALGFGVYGEIVQMLESEEHWRDVGYEVETGPLRKGELVRLHRPAENSPLQLNTPADHPLIGSHLASSMDDEVKWIVAQIRLFISGGLNPEDIMVISLDDRHARDYFREISSQLAEREVGTNNIIADPYNEPPFHIAGKVTLSTVYRAKGNEAAVVFVLGVDAVNVRSRGGRNKVFTALTRSKAWLRISGTGAQATSILQELAVAIQNAPRMEFLMPDVGLIETIQRDLSRKQAKAKAALERYMKDLKLAGLSDEEIGEQLSTLGSHLE